MQKNNVTLFIDTFHPGGAERVCVNYANELVNLGQSVNIIAFNDSESFYLDELDEKVAIQYLNVNSGLLALRYLLLDRSILENTSNIIAFNHQISILLVILKKLLLLDFKLISRNVNNLKMDLKKKHKSHIKSIMTRVLFFAFYKRMDMYIAQCEAMKRAMVEDYKIKEGKIIVVNNPVSKVFRNTNEKKDIDILFIGRLMEQKGIDNLVNVLKILSIKRPRTSVTIVGKGELAGFLESNLEKTNLDYKILPSTNNTCELYNRAKVTILTSYYEGYPNVLAESLSCNTPVVAFDCESGPSEIITDGINGYLIDCFDVESFTRKSIEILDFSVLNNVNHNKYLGLNSFIENL
ncbi:glycosyltransferase [Vibrio lentus]